LKNRSSKSLPTSPTLFLKKVPDLDEPEPKGSNSDQKRLLKKPEVNG
jgi:hypothetical protein